VVLRKGREQKHGRMDRSLAEDDEDVEGRGRIWEVGIGIFMHKKG
jgi:hypothetical protein